MKYAHILAEAEATPWMILPEKLRVIERFLARKIAGETISEAEVEAAVRNKKDRGRQPSGGVGVIPIHGTITQRATWLMEYSGGTSTELVGQWLDEMMADPGIEAIVLDVDSPGGSVYGTEELSQKIREATKQKKIIAVANSLAASAAYYLASQASELVVTPGGQVGSIGTYLMHVDRSKAMEAYGEQVTYISAGERKVAGHEYAPLDELGRDEMQRMVNDYYDQFVRAVAKGRNVSQTAVREGFGKGGLVRAEDAVKEGMADRVATFESVLARYGLSPADLAPAAESDRSAVEIRQRRMLLG